MRYVTEDDTLELVAIPKKAGAIKVHQLKGGPLHVLLSKVKVAFEPGVFGGGTGNETRLGTVLNVTEEQSSKIAAVEDTIRQHLDGDAKWYSSLKTSEDYGASFRPKINKDKVHIFSETNEPVAWPETWRGLTINALVRIGGAYSQSQGCGALWEVTHVQLQQSEEEAPTPFAVSNVC